MKPKLYGLILVGGKSTRMGRDKDLINYHGKPHREFLFDLASLFCDRVFYSIRREQENEMINLPVIIDENVYQGPFNGLLSAYHKNNKVAWLVLACDLPLLDAKSIQKLVESRDPDHYATTYATRKTGLPEPLVAIWEPTGLRKALKFIKKTSSLSARKFLTGANPKLVHPENDRVLYNANSIEDLEKIKKLLGTHDP